jgi:transglutaminase-like putative cysteine protease
MTAVPTPRPPDSPDPPDQPRRYEVTHRTEYRYAGPVTTSYGWGCLTPRDLPDQVCRSNRVEVSPNATLVSGSTDFFGNRTSYFEVHEPHDRLVVTSHSLVEVSRTRADLDTLDRWTVQQARDLLHADPRLRTEEADFLLASPRLPRTSPLLPGFAGDLLPPDQPLGATLGRLIGTIYRDFAYRSGATTVSTTLDDVLERRAGVCQDFAHLAVAALRWAGLPARYVSGYLETIPPPGQPKLQGVDASHAWVSVLVPELGWIDLDPTNNQAADASYVVTAWGRDYTDVPPLKGVIFTESAGSTLTVAVDVIRV